MKTMTIKVGTLVKLGLVVAAMELASDMGRAAMFTAVKQYDEETADGIIGIFDDAINDKRWPRRKRIKLKIVRSMCKFAEN